MSISPLRVLWPSFLVSIAACGIVFSRLDPIDLAFLAGFQDTHSIAVYSVGFIGFWIIGALSGSVTLLLTRSATEINQSGSLQRSERPAAR